jgi:adenylate cyclase
VERFATIAERLAPDELTDLLNDYFARLFAVVEGHGGTITDVVGDGLMCVWASGRRATQDRAAAVTAALAMRDCVAAFNRDHSLTPLPTRFGLHVGAVRLGAVGGAGHFAATAVGDVANTASRLQELNKHLRTRILASEEVVAGIRDVVWRPLGAFRLVGKVHALRVVEVLGRADEDGSEALAAAFAAPFAAYERGCWNDAIAGFSAILLGRPDDGPAAWFLERARQLACEAAGATSVVQMQVK